MIISHPMLYICPDHTIQHPRTKRDLILVLICISSNCAYILKLFLEDSVFIVAIVDSMVLVYVKQVEK